MKPGQAYAIYHLTSGLFQCSMRSAYWPCQSGKTHCLSWEYHFVVTMFTTTALVRWSEIGYLWKRNVVMFLLCLPSLDVKTLYWDTLVSDLEHGTLPPRQWWCVTHWVQINQEILLKMFFLSSYPASLTNVCTHCIVFHLWPQNCTIKAFLLHRQGSSLYTRVAVFYLYLPPVSEYECILLLLVKAVLFLSVVHSCTYTAMYRNIAVPIHVLST